MQENTRKYETLWEEYTTKRNVAKHKRDILKCKTVPEKTVETVRRYKKAYRKLRKW